MGLNIMESLAEWWYTVSQSSSKRFAVVLAAFVCGILVGPALHRPLFFMAGVAVLVVLVYATFRYHRAVFVLLLVMAAFVGGAFRAAQVDASVAAHREAQVTDQTVRVSGTVVRAVERRPDKQRVVLGNVQTANRAVPGHLLLYASPHRAISYGDALIFRCRVQRPEPFDGFRYDRFLAARDIYAVCYQPQDMDIRSGEEIGAVGTIFQWKRSISQRLRRHVPEPHASFMIGLLFGGSSSLAEPIRDAFANTGTAHILAASGFNVSLFSFLLLGILVQSPLGRRWGIVVVGFGIVGYVIAAGATPAVVRAGIMASLLLVAQFVGRRATVTNLFLFTLAVMLVFNPLLLTVDVGFQLSFVATAALLTLTGPIEKGLDFLPDTLGVRQSTAGSIAAIMLTLPIVIWHFGAVSLVAPIVNLLVLPLVPYIMALAGGVIVSAIVFPSFATIAVVPAWAVSNIVLHIILWFERLPLATITVAHAHVVAVVVGVLLAAYFVLTRPFSDGLSFVYVD